MNDGRKYWLDEPRNVTRICWWLCVVCALLFVADAFYHKHALYEVESWFGFYGIFSFVVCLALVPAARLLRIIVKRPEDYYD